MRQPRSMVRVAVVIAMLGCGGGKRAPAPVASPSPDQGDAPSTSTSTNTALERDMPRLAMRITGMYLAFADAVTAAGTDCARVAAGVAAARDRHRDAIDATTVVVGDGRAADLETALDPHALTIAGALRRMSPRLDSCRDHAALDEALDKLGG